jgi:hypothetical protein
MRIFDHVGVPTEEKHPGEMYVKDTKVWVTNPIEHPHKIEYLRFEADTPVTGPVRDLPHTAYRVDNLDSEIAGENVILGPFYSTPTMRVVFIEKDGAVVEFMENAEDGNWFRPEQTEK